jgi:hypothetical protein
VSKREIEVDKAKVERISKLPLPTMVRQIRYFLGHVGFYRRFIKDFSKISQPLCNNRLAEETLFNFNEDCLEAFEKLALFYPLPQLERLPTGLFLLRSCATHPTMLWVPS